MESFEALANTINRKTAVHAKALGLSVSSVAKWQEPSLDFSDSGAFNPLDRVETIIKTALGLGVEHDMALAPVHYLGEKFNFVTMLLPPRDREELPDISRQLHRVVTEFGHLLQESAEALEDGKISPAERKRIEREALHLYSALGLFITLVQKVSK